MLHTAQKMGIPPSKVVDTAETPHDVTARAVAFVENTLVPQLLEFARNGQDGVHILVVSHGGLLRTLVNYLIPHLRQRHVSPNCSVTKIAVHIVEEQTKFVLEYRNDC